MAPVAPATTQQPRALSLNDMLAPGAQPTKKAPFQPHHAQKVPKYTDLEAQFQKRQDAPVTTLMLRNIPNKYTQSTLLQEINEAGFANSYNFFYLPMDVKNGNNVGYAFINFETPEDAERFRKCFADHHFQRYHSRKIGIVCPAHVQGLDENLLQLKNRAVTQARNEQYRPLIFKAGHSIDFETAIAEAKERVAARDAAQRVEPVALRPQAAQVESLGQVLRGHGSRPLRVPPVEPMEVSNPNGLFLPQEELPCGEGLQLNDARLRLEAALVSLLEESETKRVNYAYGEQFTDPVVVPKVPSRNPRPTKVQTPNVSGMSHSALLGARRGPVYGALRADVAYLLPVEGHLEDDISSPARISSAAFAAPKAHQPQCGEASRWEPETIDLTPRTNELLLGSTLKELDDVDAPWPMLCGNAF